MYYILGAIGSLGVAGYLLYTIQAGPEIIVPIFLACMGGAFLGMCIYVDRVSQLEDALRRTQERIQIRGERLMMPWDRDIIDILISRSSLKFPASPEERRPEGVTE